MSDTVIYIDGQIVDLAPGTVVACTFKAFEVGNIKTRTADYTNLFKLPPTENNLRIIQNADNVKSGTLQPYRKLPAKIVQGGLEVMPSAVAIITEISSFISVNIYANVKSFFESIEGLDVDEIDFEEYEVIDDTYIASIRNSTTLVSAPVIDFGTLFPPEQELENTFFEGSLSPWSNEDAGTDWQYDAGIYQKIFCRFTSAGAFSSKYLTQEYKFFTGVTYRVEMVFDALGFDPGCDVTLSVRKDVTRSSLPTLTVPLNNFGITYDETFTAAADYDFIEILVSAIIISPNSDLVLKSIQITDVSAPINIKASRYIPLLSYSQIIEKIVTDAGYQLDIFSDAAFYEKLFITFSKDEYGYPDSLIEKMEFNYSAPGTQILTINSATKQEVLFNVENSNGAYGWYNGTHTYAPQNIGYNFEVVVKARIIVDIVIGGTDTIALHFKSNGVTDTAVDSVTATGRYVFNVESNAISAGMAAFGFSLTWSRIFGSSSSTVEVVEGQFWSEVNTKAFGTINISALVLPTVKQKDFFKDFLYRFGVLVKEKNGVVYLRTIQGIISDRTNARDWTGKRDTSIRETIDFKSSYAQDNIFSDVINEDFVIRDETESLLIDNETLPESTEYYTSIMSSTQQNNNLGMQVCRVPVFDEINAPGGIGNYPANPRLFYLRTEKDSDSEVKYNSSTETSYLVAVYNDNLVPYNTTWRYFVNNYYGLFGTALQKSKTVVRYYTLTEYDISIFDPFILVYDDGDYFMVNKIENFRPGVKTKVELFKVS
jgi:hypothetical protein